MTADSMHLSCWPDDQLVRLPPEIAIRRLQRRVAIQSRRAREQAYSAGCSPPCNELGRLSPGGPLISAVYFGTSWAVCSCKHCG